MVDRNVQMQTDNIFADIVFGIMFLSVGLRLTFGRKKTIDALISSNQVFWSKIGFAPDEKRARAVTGIIIPIMGVVFLAVAALMIYRVVVHFLK